MVGSGSWSSGHGGSQIQGPRWVGCPLPSASCGQMYRIVKALPSLALRMWLAKISGNMQWGLDSMVSKDTRIPGVKQSILIFAEKFFAYTDIFPLRVTEKVLVCSRQPARMLNINQGKSNWLYSLDIVKVILS